MTASSLLPAPNLMPLMRYRDLAEAMGWLEQAFGFEKQIAVSDGDGSVIYGQMIYRGSLMMMGAVRDTDLDKLMRQPDEVGGVETQSCYLVVEDADAHYAQAQEAGADIVLELKSDGLGRRGYSCRDPEGHIWNFGTYNPGKGLTMTVASPAAEVPEAPRRNPRLLMSFAALLLAVGSAFWWLGGDVRAGLATRIAAYAGHQSAQEAEKAYAELVTVRAEKRKADEAAAEATKALETERARRVALEASSGDSDKLAEEVSARRAAEAAVAVLREELKRKQDALDDAIEAKRVSEEKLAVKSAEGKIATETPKQQATSQTGTPPQSTAKGIETSATRLASKAETSADEPPVTKAAKESGSQSAIPRGDGPPASKRRLRASKPKPPLYVIEMNHTWPYNGWTNSAPSSFP